METPTPNVSATVERDCNALGGLFQIIINDLRGGANNWDDLLLKANKFHQQLKSTIHASTAFLDSFQKIADMATTTRSGTKEIGSALTRLCLRHRSVEAKLKTLTNSLHDSFILPLQDRVEDWKRIFSQLDKDHCKELKRLKHFKKKQVGENRTMSGFANTTFRIKKNPRTKLKNDFSRIGSMYDINKIIESMENKEKYFMLEEVERNYVRRALIEERSHYCLFFNYLRPFIEEELSMLQEITHLEEIANTLVELTLDPYKLPAASESLLTNLQLSDSVSLDQTFSELDSPTSTLYRSRKSSISSINSINSFSTDSISLQNCKSLSQPNMLPQFRPKSIASQDSGFISHDYNVPNFGRLFISNKNKNITEENLNLNGNMRISNGKSTINSVQRSLPKIDNSNQMNCRSLVVSCGDCFDGEYASTDQLYSNNDNSIGAYNGLAKQPIYVNLGDTCNSLSLNGLYNVNASDGSITPTNQECHYDTSDNDNNINIKKIVSIFETKKVDPVKPRLSKSCPPKPPVRQSSTLSSTASKPPTVNTNLKHQHSNRSATRIYVVQQDKNNMFDFPPPPPEAYVNYATPENNMNNNNINNNRDDNAKSNSDHINNNKESADCCDYTTYSNTHLVLCNDANCLKAIANYDNRKSLALSEAAPAAYTHYSQNYADNVRKSYAFESNQSAFVSCNNSISRSIRRGSNSDTNSLITSLHALNSNNSGNNDSNEYDSQCDSSRQFHSTINLAHKHQ